MVAREERLKTDIERTKQDLAEHLSELRVEAGAAERKAARVAGIALGAYAVYRLIKFAWKRGR